MQGMREFSKCTVRLDLQGFSFFFTTNLKGIGCCSICKPVFQVIEFYSCWNDQGKEKYLRMRPMQ